MNLFGKQLGPEQVAALVFSLMALVIWFGALKGERNWARFLRGWEAERRQRRDAEIAAEGGTPPTSADPKAPRGPWG